jgi:hypothetical protein
MYVWEALLTEQYEQDRSYGLFTHKTDAKRACQHDSDNRDWADVPSPLPWRNESATRATAVTGRSANESYDVVRRKVHTMFVPTKR